MISYKELKKQMKKIYKKIYIILGIFMLGTFSLFMISHKQTKLKYIEYNGYKLALSVDGNYETEIPSGNYFLVSYECDNGSILTWDRDNSTLTTDNININDSCYLEFESSPLLYDLVSIGDYISYTGIGDGTNNCSTTNQSSDESCTNCNACNGWNASQTATDIYDNYGYCSSSHKYYVYGWRVIHKTDNSVYIVSAGSPECVSGTISDLEENKTSLNSASLKYCNTLYLSGGICDKTTAHALNGDDFYKFTSQYFGSSNGRYLYSYNDGGAYGKPYCYDVIRNTYCGYNNDIIDNGGSYWFGSGWSNKYTLNWSPSNRKVSRPATSPSTYGVRPVLKLDSTIRATGGSGVMTNPYEISERVVE